MKEKVDALPVAPPPPPALELLGLSVPRLIHELNNVLTVLAGNIDLADRLLDRPDAARERLRSAQETLTKFDRRLTALASWVRQFPAENTPWPLSTLDAELEEQRDTLRPWVLHERDLPPIHTTLSRPWFRFLLTELHRLLPHVQGQIAFACVRIPRLLRYFTPPQPSGSRRLALMLQLDWRSSQPPLPPDDYEKPIQPEWLVLFELTRWHHGDIHFHFDPAACRNSLAFYLPVFEKLTSPAPTSGGDIERAGADSAPDTKR